ncbi:hypothetical protein SUGI_0701060 [Cryptomeria japonica]|nr:hypothetical protein SUGI_0701060 [Cryptomeria japonica]
MEWCLFWHAKGCFQWRYNYPTKQAVVAEAGRRVVKEKVVGVDLGTSCSAVAAMEGGKPTNVGTVFSADEEDNNMNIISQSQCVPKVDNEAAVRIGSDVRWFFMPWRFTGRGGRLIGGSGSFAMKRTTKRRKKRVLVRASVKDIMFDQDSGAALQVGIDKPTNVVDVTFGSRRRNVMFDEFGCRR